MKNTVNFWIRHLFPFFLALFLGLLMYMLAQFREPPGFEWYAFFWFLGAVYLIWESGWWISNLLDKQFPWKEGTFKRLGLQLLLTNLFGVLLFLGTFVLLNWYETTVKGSVNELGWLHIVVSIAEAFIIVQIVNSVQIGYLLLEAWQKAQLETEAYKRMSVIARLESVQQKIDPYFLNDNFSELEKIIRQSPNEVSVYLKELSENYSKRQNQLSSTLIKVQQTLKTTSDADDKKKQHFANEIPVYKNRFLVRSGGKLFLIPTKEIIAFCKDDLVLLYTNAGKKYAVDHSLEELNKLLHPKCFFRINRQSIVNARFLKEMKSEGNQLYLTMPAPCPNPLAVSQRNVRKFKLWLNEEL